MEKKSSIHVAKILHFFEKTIHFMPLSSLFMLNNINILAK